MLRVLIADDSPTARQALSYIVQTAGDMQVVGEARDGRHALQLADELRPDVVLMDITMPEMDGLEATGEIMHRSPTPIVIVSGSLEGRETEIAFQAIRAGALTVLPKPPGFGAPNFLIEAAKLQNTVRAMAGVSVIHHWKQRRPETKPVETTARTSAPPEIVAIVSSTGGPAALSEILGRLPGDFPIPVVVVQHIAADFLPSLVKWLDGIAPLTVSIAQPGGQPKPGNVYIAPGQAHLCLDRSHRFSLDTTTPGRHSPSGDVLFESVASAYREKAIGVVLTGMGDDGAHGLRAMYKAGAFTIAQDESSSAVYGMPREAAAQGATCEVLPLNDIAGALIDLTRKKERSS
jgi:two-component system chemotaxis response regulator CheB